MNTPNKFLIRTMREREAVKSLIGDTIRLCDSGKHNPKTFVDVYDRDRRSCIEFMRSSVFPTNMMSTTLNANIILVCLDIPRIQYDSGVLKFKLYPDPQ